MLGKLFGFSGDKKPSSPKNLSPAIIEAIFNVVGHKSIPPMPGAAQKAFKLSTDPNAEARDFIEVIESDEALSARVIKIANSVYFDRGHQSKTIEDSVVVIGINELRCLLSSTSLSDIFPSGNPLRHIFWAHDVACAIISKMLAGRMCPQNSDLAFLCGLMHDIGKLLLIQRAPDDYAKVIKMVEEKGEEFSRAEEQVFLFTHTDAGQLIAEKWNFSDELRDVIKNHHEDWDLIKANSTHFQLVHIVKAASIFAHALGLGHGKSFARLKNKVSEHCRETFEVLGIPESEDKTLLSNFARTFETEFDLYSGQSQSKGAG
jgi:putative nucleotidyltransferase with HDIG domain